MTFFHFNINFKAENMRVFVKIYKFYYYFFFLEITIEIWKHFLMFLFSIFMFQFLVGRCRLWLFWLCLQWDFQRYIWRHLFLEKKNRNYLIFIFFFKFVQIYIFYYYWIFPSRIRVQFLNRFLHFLLKTEKNWIYLDVQLDKISFYFIQYCRSYAI